MGSKWWMDYIPLWRGNSLRGFERGRVVLVEVELQAWLVEDLLYEAGGREGWYSYWACLERTRVSWSEIGLIRVTCCIWPLWFSGKNQSLNLTSWLMTDSLIPAILFITLLCLLLFKETTTTQQLANITTQTTHKFKIADTHLATYTRVSIPQQQQAENPLAYWGYKSTCNKTTQYFNSRPL